MGQRGNLIIGILIGLVIAGGLFGSYYLGTLKTNKPQITNPVITSRSVQTSSKPYQATSIPSITPNPTLQNQNITLPVQNINIGYREGDTQCKTVSNTTASEQFTGIPSQMVNDFSAYGLQNCGGYTLQMFIGPKGWFVQGAQGADGSMTASLYPSSNYKPSDPHIILDDAGYCSGCTLDEASPFFSAAKVEYDKNFPPSPEKVTISKMEQITPKLVNYSLPNTTNGLEVNGIAYFDINQSHFIKIETTLPQSEHNLATIILNSFIQKEGLDKK